MKKYQELFKEMEEAIHQGVYEVGEFLPSEHELMETHQVSRDTVRKALSLLQEEGFIQKIRGQGSKVLRKEQIDLPVSNLTSYHELVEQLGISSKTNVVSLDKITVDEKLSQMTGFPKYRLVWRITRQRIVDKVTSVLDIDYLDKSLVPDISREIAEESIYRYLEDQLGLEIAYAQKEITIDHINDRDRLLMDLGNDHHVVSIKSKGYLVNGQQFQFTESRHKLEKFRFVDFATRKK